MRLIDVDAIPWEVGGVGEIPVITKEEIDEMPIVDAIPIEYIQKTSKEWARDGYEESAEALDILMSNWVTERKEE